MYLAVSLAVQVNWLSEPAAIAVAATERLGFLHFGNYIYKEVSYVI